MQTWKLWNLLKRGPTSFPGYFAQESELVWRVAAGLCAGVVAAAGGMILVGWALEFESLKAIVPGLSTMKANAAVAFMLCGLALALNAFDGTDIRRRSGRVLALCASGIGLLTLLEYGVGIDLGIDQLLFAASDEAGHAVPGRMSPPTAFAFLAFGAALALPRDLSRVGGGSFLTLTHLGVAGPALAALGYLFGVQELYAPTPYTAMAIPTALAFLVLFVGLSLSRLDIGWMALLRSPGPAGVLTRRLLPTIIILPVAFGWLRIQGQLAGFYDLQTGTALLTATNVVILSVVVWLSVRRVERLEQLRRREERLHQSALETALDAFILMDAQGRVVEWNPQAEKIFGWSRGEAFGRKIGELIVPRAQRAAHAAGLARFLATGEGPALKRRNEMIALRRDGSEFPVELIITPIHLDHQIAFSGFVRDVSEQKRIEEQLRQAQKMEAVGQLTGGVAHDFNNLLTVIIGSLDVVVDRVGVDMRHVIENALEAADRGATLVQQLLAVSRRQTLMPATVGFNELASEMKELLHRSLGEEVEIEMLLNSELWPAFADKGQVQNALLNLAINARDAMPGGGKLTIETGNATLDEDYAARNQEVRPGEYVMLALTDTGSGMTPEVLKRALEPFYTTKSVGKGTGLGLSMVYGFAKQSRGHLKIYSEVGHGTTVRLYLPRFVADGSIPATASDAGQRHEEIRGHETILVVEDDTAVRAHVVAQLIGLGYDVIEAQNGIEAQGLLEGGARIDLLFTDVVMPGGVAGRQLAERAMRLRPGLKTLFTSGYTENSIAHHGRLDADVHFLPKPYRRQELARKVREALDTPVTAATAAC